ncbi:putative NBD/HSP70 family sugar kinase [Thermocatellispora tengchongensis]|uniref:Putative NBD/HSP70 family sugar kinase n=1 Tax=Thermocatellispora tengchongensis TaxID=1073253 RepID=A0A840PDY4_9ACTN|nr:ROK family protein [Thermocatellispora tengchongensis]MBB5137199.1 putative NBD/HSP70 family sugar kinase [Thermocatellispora tengchongensis]
MVQDTPGALLSILRDGQPRTRAELVQLTGLARSTVSQRLDALLLHHWIVPADQAISSGGRPSTAFTFNPRARIALAADIGVTRARLAVTDLRGVILAERAADMAVAQGPEVCLTWVLETFDELLAECGHRMSDVCGVGVGLPGPVEHESGRPVNPPLMPGWDGFPVADRLRSRIGVPVLVDNDVNIMALGEHSATDPTTDDLLFAKVGTGIGCGIIAGGRLHRGARGAAGDIGHIRVPASDVVCHCGNTGCLEAVAGGGALAARLREEGLEAAGARDVVRLVRAGNTWAIRLVRQSGRDLGLVLASIVNFFNPAQIVIGGDLAEAGEHLIAGIREVIYGRSLPLATQRLHIRASELGVHAGVMGAAMMIVEHVLAPESVDQSVQG